MRHKRQALQDMARPLKQWLYKHRDNPYPTKTEKILLALGSQMTLVQVIQTLPNWISPARGWEAETQGSCDCASSFLGGRPRSLSSVATEDEVEAQPGPVVKRGFHP